jgi:molecular chaperone DnaK (HSP70)
LNIEDKKYIIGIDLGTTNSAVSYVDLQQDIEPQIKIFRIPQLTGPGEFSTLPVLPSFLYIPGDYDISKDAVAMPWIKSPDQGAGNFVGAFARDHGVKVPSRLVSSAKSWLCNAGVDRHARILPWGTGEDVPKISPVRSTASYLEHIKHAWNNGKGDDEEQFLEHQVLIITVPASFDEVARDLTVEAAAMAGLNHVTLLEEPLAAFYSWLIRHEGSWDRYVKENELVLICDVGGGTTDFTLITLMDREGSPRFERLAVGDHLILGGDNIDIALAEHVESHVGSQNVRLTPDRWKTLCHQCRQAKEEVLGGEAEAKRITLMGEGSRLIAGTIFFDLQRRIVEQKALEEFFPMIDPNAPESQKPRRLDPEFGLPLEREPAITRHIVEFLSRHCGDVEKELHKRNARPDLVLFNGGSLKPAVIQERIRAAIRHYFNEDDHELPRVLENPNPELAVAMGAAYYGLVKMGHGVRVGSGSARSYFLGIDRIGEDDRQPSAKSAICLVERGLEEGTDIALTDKRFEVLTNQPVSFDMYSSSFRSGDRCGDLVKIDDSLTPLPPIQTIVQYGKKGGQKTIPIGIEATYSEMGTLSLWCRSLMTDHRWQLRFQLRKPESISDVTDVEVFESAIMDQTRSLIRQSFSKRAETDALQNMVNDIVKIVERPRDSWPLAFIRTISDELVERSKARTLGPEYESRWLNLAGFCMRPGFGDGFDPHRMKRLWKIYLQGPIHARHAQVRSEWWIIWRRVAGGMKSGQQRQFLQDLAPLLTVKKDSKARVSPQEHLEIWMAVANMEQLFVKEKVKWGRILLSEIKPKKARPQQFWALSRIGARQPLYGSLDRVISPEEVGSWIDQLLSMNWRNPKPVAAALAQLARRTGDRARDLDATIAQRIVDWMPKDDYFYPHMKFLSEIVPLAKQEESVIFGESLPSGILLRD